MSAQVLHGPGDLLLGQIGIGAGEHISRFATRRLQQFAVAQQIGHAKVRHACLAGAEELARAALLQVEFGNLEAVLGAHHSFEPLLGLHRNFTASHQHAVRLRTCLLYTSGGEITLDITSVEYYDTVFALAESPLQKGMLWAGTDDGLIHLTRDDGKTWENVTPKDMPEWSMVSIIEASHHDAGTAYAAIDRHKLDDLNPLIYKTHDFGKSWIRIANGIPSGSYVRSVREDPKMKGLLYAGTETGVYFSADDGAHWQSLQLNLPTSPVHDLAVKDDDLVAATHGRSFWILDDVSPLRQANSAMAAADFHLYQPATAIRLHFSDEVDRKRPVGDNPPKGAILDYYLQAKPAEKEAITIEILDAQGKLVRKLSNHKESKQEQPPEWPDREKPAELLPAEAGICLLYTSLWSPP